MTILIDTGPIPSGLGPIRIRYRDLEHCSAKFHRNPMKRNPPQPHFVVLTSRESPTQDPSERIFVKGSALKRSIRRFLNTFSTKESQLAMDAERLNSPSTSAIRLEVMGHQLHFSQDPNSKHLGTTVWDASVVFAKYLEKNCRKGRFCPTKLKGKRVIELGAGCGVAGFGMALLGCDVISTDQVEVLPLLIRNIERNTSRVMQTNPDSASFGSIQVMELDWGNQEHIKAVDPPFDYVIGTDVVYAEHLLEPLLKTILSVSGPKTTIMLGYEIRSTTVHEQMLQMWKNNFDVKTIPKAKMDSKYQHASIQLFMMWLKPGLGSLENMAQRYDGKISEVRTEASEANEEKSENSSEVEEVEDIGTTEVNEESQPNVVLKNGKLSDWEARRYDGKSSEVRTEASDANEEKGESSSEVEEVEDIGTMAVNESQPNVDLKNGKLSDWEARRYGSMAARLLRDVKIT